MPSFLLRLPDDLHHVARIAAATRGQSLQAWLLAAVRAQCLRDATSKRGAPVATALDAQAKK